jgi:hypothetical protein
MKKRDIYTLELHELFFTSNGIAIIRVPGGWIYKTELSSNIIFVPFDNEFMDNAD